MSNRYYNTNRGRGGSYGSSNGRNNYSQNNNDSYGGNKYHPYSRPQPRRGGLADQRSGNNSAQQQEVSNGISKDSQANETKDQKLTDSGTSHAVKDPSPPTNTNGDNSDAAEKKRLRQEKLALWKKKKEEEEKAKQGLLQSESPRQEQPIEQQADIKSHSPSPITSQKIEKPLVKGLPSLSKLKGNASFGLRKFGIIKKPIISNTIMRDLKTDNEKLPVKKFTMPVMKKRVDEIPVAGDDNDLDSFMSQLSESADGNANDTGSMEVDEANDESNAYADDDDNQDQSEDDDDDPMKLLEELNSKNKKSIPDIPPSTELFERDFYQESDYVKHMTVDEVKSLRLREGITVRGKNTQKPILSWSQLGLPIQITSILETLKFESPTAIQCEALPNIMSGNDLIGIAKTGSGKTLAFLLPLFRHIMAQRRLSKGDGPLALIMTPTRELAMQIFKECKPFLKSLDLRGCCAYGGASISQQIAEMKKGVHLVVCTPGRLIDLLAANSGRVTNLSRVTYFVIDEADRMFDLGFEPQVMKIVKVIRPDRQTVLFSATFPPKMEMLARKLLYKPVEILVGTKSVVSDTITQHVFILEEKAKFGKLVEILSDALKSDPEGKVIIFMDRQDSCDKLVANLIEKGYFALSLHGGKEQTDRDGAISDFKKGIVNILIATSVASRGLDVKDLNFVINYDSPTHMEDYVHRVGRTGRAGKLGQAFTFITPVQEKAAADVTRALELSNVEVPDTLKKLSQEFYSKLKAGNQKFSSGFGGHGLEKLEEIRTNARNIEKSAYGIDTGDSKQQDGEEKSTHDTQKDNTNTTVNLDVESSTELDTYGIEKSDFKVYETEGTDKQKKSYYTKIQINDLPQEVRWYATNGDQLERIIELSGCSVITRGRFYPAGKGPAGEKDDPKLYLLLEDKEESSVRYAAGLLKQYMIEGIKKSQNSLDRKTGGRYTVA